MAATDPLTYLLTKNADLLHDLLAASRPLSAYVYVRLEPDTTLHIFPTDEAEAEHVVVPSKHRRRVLAEIAKPRSDDELLLFTVRGASLIVTRVDRARIARDVGPRTLIDPRNHLPVPWPMGWYGPYALERRDTYRVDTPDCTFMARIEPEAWDYKDIDAEGNPRHMWLLEIAVERALDPAVASDEQVAEITARFRHCGAWFERTSHYRRHHPSRRFFGAEIHGHQEGTLPWPEIKPLPGVMLGPPPGWEPVGPYRDPPIVFRIEGTKLHVEWTPPPGVDGFEAATGRAREPSRFVVTAEARKPTNEEVSTVFAMLGGASFKEETSPRPAAKGKSHARVFRATAGWLRKSSGRA
jgi:hypothetical protein